MIKKTVKINNEKIHLKKEKKQNKTEQLNQMKCPFPKNKD